MKEPREVLQLLSHLPVFVFESQKNDFWTLAYASPAGLDLTGYSSQELEAPGRWGELVGSDIAVREQVERLVVNGEAFEVVCRLRNARGKELSVSLGGRGVPVEDGRIWVGTARDVTLEMKSKRESLEAAEKFAAVYTASPYLIGISEAGTGRYLDVNHAFEVVSGFSREEVLGRSAMELNIWVDIAERKEMFRKLQENPQQRGLVLHFRKKNGEVIVARSGVDLITWEGKPCLLSVLEDVTEQYKAEESRVRMELQLQQTQKLESLGQLAGGIAHDFNNIMAGVMANIDLARLQLHEPDLLEQRLDEMKKAGVRARDLVRRILTFSRQQASERRPLDLLPVVREAVGLLSVGLPATTKIEVALDPGTPWVLADPTQIHQILMNLGTNSAHALSSKTGRIVFRLDPEVLVSDSHQPDRRPGRYARLSVEDTGSGMDKEILKHLFEPFFTTKGTGTGLGLSVVHGIVKNHEGILEIESQPGVGTVCRIYFPENHAPQTPEASEILGHQTRSENGL